MTRSILTGLLFVICVGAVAAQDPNLPPGVPVIQGGILNGKAVSLPKPEYPEQAIAASISGRVGVDVTVDEQGLVTSAVADKADLRAMFNANGDREPLAPVDASLREAAERAALQARFSRTLLNGSPVKVTGRIVYDFVADKSGGQVRVSDIYGPPLNSRAIDLPQPEMPPAARAVHAGGSVAVHVVLDPDGNVLTADAITGHPLLRSPAEAAAKKARFDAATAAVHEGVITYYFKATAPSTPATSPISHE